MSCSCFPECSDEDIHRGICLTSTHGDAERRVGIAEASSGGNTPQSGKPTSPLEDQILEAYQEWARVAHPGEHKGPMPQEAIAAIANAVRAVAHAEVELRKIEKSALEDGERVYVRDAVAVIVGSVLRWMKK